MLIAEILLNMTDSAAEETTYLLTAAEIVELIEAANNGYVIHELIADDNKLILTLDGSKKRKIVATYSSVG